MHRYLDPRKHSSKLGARIRRGLSAASALLLFCGLLGFAPSCDSSSPPADTGVEDSQLDTAGDSTATDSACVQRGGTCVDGAPESDPPGFTVTCPDGYALDDGRTSLTDGGIDIIQSSLALGCSRNPDGTTKPALCCLPVDRAD